MEDLTNQDWEFYIITLRGKDVLTKTVKRYIGETKKLLRYFGLDHPYLAEYREEKNPLRRSPTLRPKKEICALEWAQVQRICDESRMDERRKYDNLLGRTVLTFAFTTGTRVGSILPPRYGHRRRTHVPLTRSKLRWVGQQCHVWQPKSKTDKEGRGRLIVVSPTHCCACPIRTIRRLLWCPSDSGNRLFSHGMGEATSDWFLK